MSPIKHTVESVTKEALKYSTRNEFKKGSPKQYNAARPRRLNIMDAVCAHMVAQRESWTLPKLYQLAEKYSCATEFRSKEPAAVNYAQRSGVYEQVVRGMVQKYNFRSDTDITKIALKYSSKTDFYKDDRSAYTIARYRGILDKVCSHMTPPVVLNREIDSIYADALLYGVREEYKRKNPASYYCAYRYGIMDDVCSHMTEPVASDADVFYVWKPKDVTFEGIQVYKLGITSSRLGDSRISTVARAGSYTDIEVVRMFTVEKHTAYKIEAEVLKIGLPVVFSTTFNGSTEFRAMTCKELNTVLEIAGSKEIKES